MDNSLTLVSNLQSPALLEHRLYSELPAFSHLVQCPFHAHVYDMEVSHHMWDVSHSSWALFRSAPGVVYAHTHPVLLLGLCYPNTLQRVPWHWAHAGVYMHMCSMCPAWLPESCSMSPGRSPVFSCTRQWLTEVATHPLLWNLTVTHHPPKALLCHFLTSSVHLHCGASGQHLCTQWGAYLPLITHSSISFT